MKAIISTYTERSEFDRAISARDDFLEVERGDTVQNGFLTRDGL